MSVSRLITKGLRLPSLLPLTDESLRYPRGYTHDFYKNWIYLLCQYVSYDTYVIFGNLHVKFPHLNTVNLM